MKILIAADMEGITGVVTWDQVRPGHAEYSRFRGLMTEDVNAAARGAFDGGADEVSVVDGHWAGANILIEELDRRIRLIAGSPSPLSMMQGVDETVDGVLFVGYHARNGSANAILDHTWSALAVANVWLNDTLTGEYGLNAALAGHFGVPVVMISGDQTACAQAAAQLGEIELAIVKQATGRFSADCLSASEAQQLIRDAAGRAVRRLAAGTAPAPFVAARPVTIRVEVFTSDMADQAALAPGVERAANFLSFTAPDMPAAYQAFRAIVSLAKSG